MKSFVKFGIIFLITIFSILIFRPEETLADDINIAICGTYYSESYQADDDIIALLESCGAHVTKVNSSVDVSQYDGLVIPGGIDIDPAMYGESNYACEYTDINFDIEQFAILDKFVKASKPVLGICRGFQVLNVYFGGTLYQNVTGHRSPHMVYSSAGSQLGSLCGDFYASSTHHQAIKSLGNELVATQWAPDGLIEGVEHNYLPVIGVLWHPEITTSVGRPLVNYFLYSVCAANKGPRVIYRDGAWVYVNSWNEIDRSYTGLARNTYGWWYVKDGYVDFSYTGIKPNEYGWWRIEEGRVNFDYTGVAQNEFGWWYIEDGCVRFDYSGLAQNPFGWWRIDNGAVNFDYTGVAPNEYGWWYLENGRVNFDYTGIKPNEFGWWRIENGKVNFWFTGIAQNEFGSWYIEEGRVRFDYTGPYTDWYGNIYNIIEGKVS